MNKIKFDQFGRVINEYGQTMGSNGYRWDKWDNWGECYDSSSPKSNPCVEVDLPEKKQENKHKYLLIRR